MKKNYIKYIDNLAGIVSFAVIMGFLFGLIKAVSYILTNKYLHHKLYDLILLGFRENMNQWTLLFLIICISLFTAILMWTFILEKAVLPVMKKITNSKILQNFSGVKIVINSANRFITSIFFIAACIFLGPVFLKILRSGLDSMFKPGRQDHFVNSFVFVNFIKVVIVLFLFLFFYKILPFFYHAVFQKALKIKKHKVPALGMIVFIIILNLGGYIYKTFSNPKGPNVILVSIDTLRTDHLGCYGYGRNTSPNIDSFAKESILFENAIVPRPITTPSVVSFLTGLYPHTHEVRNWLVPMKAEYNSLAEYLKNYRFHTAAFICNWILKDPYSGLANGFDIYDDKMSTPHYKHLPFQRIAKDVNEDVYRWLGKRVGPPFFLWLHYMDPHSPYSAPDSFEEYRAEEPLFIKKTSVEKWVLSSSLGPGQQTETELNASALIIEYDKEIRYCDHYIGELLKKLKEMKLYRNSLIIITSDHGESLIEHDFYFGHGMYTYDVCSKVPLLIKLPETIANDWGIKGKRIKEQVGLIDIVPTVLDVMNRLEDRSFDGRSLLHLIKGSDKGLNKYFFIENMNRIKAVRTDKWKYIEYYDDIDILGKMKKKKGERELFDLKNDPYEEKNLLDFSYPGIDKDKYKSIAKILKEELERWKNENDEIKIKKLSQTKMDKKSREALESLGYL